MTKAGWFILLIFSVSGLRCSDHDQAAETVYIAGAKAADDSCQGLLWVQGSPTPLTDEFSCTNIRGIFLVTDVSLQANDIIAVGVAADGRGGSWTNGVFSPLQGLSPGDQVVPQSIGITGSATYVVGNNRFAGLLWENGVPDTLLRPILRPGVQTRFTAVVAGGSAIAVSGSVVDEDLINPVLWLDGVPTMLDTLGAYPFGVANDVAIDQGEKYVAGTLYDSRPIGLALSRPVMWINGTLKVLASTGVANAITVSNGDVYVAGRELSFPVYWKNDEEAYPLSLPPQYNSGTATDIVVLGSDIYVVGTVNSDKQSLAAYWKNDVLVVLGGNLATAIHVQPK